jgi:hypothetical protein
VTPELAGQYLRDQYYLFTKCSSDGIVPRGRPGREASHAFQV